MEKHKDSEGEKNDAHNAAYSLPSLFWKALSLSLSVLALVLARDDLRSKRQGAFAQSSTRCTTTISKSKTGPTKALVRLLLKGENEV